MRNWGSRVATRLREMSDVEKAWVGAMIDAEGSIVKRRDFYCVTLNNTSVEIISALLRVTQIGGVGFNRPNSPLSKKDIYRWEVYAKDDVYTLVKAVFPYLASKHEIAQRVLVHGLPPRTQGLNLAAANKKRWDTYRERKGAV